MGRPVALVGYDDIDFAQSAVVPLTSIRRPRAEIGSSAIDLLVAATNSGAVEPDHSCYRPDLIERASTVPVGNRT